MGDYYQILGIEQSAGADEIKRAYFQKVRKYPPERYPEEFKELRAAYETLSDEMGREKYDKGLALKSSLPGEAVGLLEEAALARKSGLAEKAEELIKTAADKFTDFPELKKELGMFYLSESKSGKAAAVFEKLCRKFPDSADYASALAQAYMERGWRKKAIAEYKRAIRLDPVFLGPRIGLFDCYYMSREWDNLEEACADAERAAEEMGGEAFLLYTAMSAVMIGNEPELAEWYLKEAVRILRDIPGVPREAAELMIGETLNKIMVIGSVRMFPYFRQMTETLKNVNAELADMMKNAERIYVIETLSDRGYSLLFHDLFANLMNDCDCDNCRCELASMEFHVLSNFHEFRPQLTRLKEEYPELYGMHEKFFGEALTTRFPKKLMDKREKFLAKRGFSPAANFDGDTLDDFMEDLEDFITMRRETPKIGRNDPCPCGSGKKYKRCCGA